MEPPAGHLRRRARPVLDRAARAGSAVVGNLADASPPSLVDAIRAAAFWASIALPCVHVPLFLGLGLSKSTTGPLVALWALHAVALAAGAGHDPDGAAGLSDIVPTTE